MRGVLGLISLLKGDVIVAHTYWPEHIIMGAPSPCIYLCPRCQAGLVRDLTPFDMGHHCPKCGNNEPGLKYVLVDD